jgi:hypothetical protein
MSGNIWRSRLSGGCSVSRAMGAIQRVLKEALYSSCTWRLCSNAHACASLRLGQEQVLT